MTEIFIAQSLSFFAGALCGVAFSIAASMRF